MSSSRAQRVNPTRVSILIATQGLLVLSLESYAHCSRYLTRLSARNKLTLLAPDKWGDNISVVSVSVQPLTLTVMFLISTSLSGVCPDYCVVPFLAPM